MAKKRRFKIEEFSKIWVNRLLWFGCIWITWSYILASFSKMSIAEALSQTVAKVIIATILGYLLRAFFGKYFEKKNEIKEKELDIYSGKNDDEESKDEYESEE